MVIKNEINQVIRNIINLSLQFILVAGVAGCRSSLSGPGKKLDDYKKKYVRTVAHFSRPKDSLKLKAAYYMLANLDDQYYVDGDWLHLYQEAIFKSGDRSVKTLVRKLDSVRQVAGSKLDTIRDIHLLTDSLLIASIESAFETRRYKWTADMSFDEFCEYVLPYKIGNEKPEDWRREINAERYLTADSLRQLSTEFEATAYVNKHLNWYNGSLNFEYPVDVGYAVAHAISTGTCYSISRMALFQMRGIGLPVAMDYAPNWGNRSEGHFWTALIKNGKSYPLDPTGPNIGSYKIEFKGKDRMPYKISKVFRQTFSIQEETLAAICDRNVEIPYLFRTKRIRDVTDQYVPVSDITLSYKSNLNNKFAYLYTFNDRTWTPCFWGRVTNNKILFRKMGKDVLYLPGIYLNDNEMIPLGNPFILDAQGIPREIVIQKKRLEGITLRKKYPEDTSNDIEKNDLYELFYWDGQWRSLGRKIAKNNFLHYDKVPLNALFWLRDLTKGKQERIFTYANGRQVWW